MNHIMLPSHALTYDHRGSSKLYPRSGNVKFTADKTAMESFFSIYHKHSILIHSTPRLYNLSNCLCR